MKLVVPEVYADEELQLQARKARQAFVEARQQEESRCADFYDRSFEEAAAIASSIFEETDGLRSLSDSPRMLCRPGVLSVLRYMQRPSVSEDDFKS